MNKYNFSTEADRTNTSSVKTHKKLIKNFFDLDYNDNTISLWVSEMDFVMPPEISEAIVNRVNKGVLGYTAGNSNYFSSVINWFKNKYAAEINKNWILYSHGTVPAIRNVIRIFTNPLDKVIIQPPVYGQFSTTIKETNRLIASNSLVKTEDGYNIDFDNFEELASQKETKLFILCNPHNPMGLVWSEEDILRLLEITKKHDVLVFADEVHAEIIREGSIFNSTSKYDYEHVITANALSKGFNVTGLHVTHLVIRNEELRKKYADYCGFSSISPIAMETTIATYTKAGDWLLEVNKVIDDNFRFVDEYIKKNIPKLGFNIPKGSYLAWLDFSNYKLGTQKMMQYLATEASVVLESGMMFGKEGKNHARMMIATPRPVLEEVMNRLKVALNKL